MLGRTPTDFLARLAGPAALALAGAAALFINAPHYAFIFWLALIGLFWAAYGGVAWRFNKNPDANDFSTLMAFKSACAFGAANFLIAALDLFFGL